MHVIRMAVTGALCIALAPTFVPTGTLAGPTSLATAQSLRLSSSITSVDDRGYHRRYYAGRFGYYGYGYDPRFATLGATTGAAVIGAYGYGSDYIYPYDYGAADPYAYGAPYPYPGYPYPDSSFGYGYGYPIHGGYRHRYWGSAVGWPGVGNRRGWGGGFGRGIGGGGVARGLYGSYHYH